MDEGQVEARNEAQAEGIAGNGPSLEKNQVDESEPEQEAAQEKTKSKLFMGIIKDTQDRTGVSAMLT